MNWKYSGDNTAAIVTDAALYSDTTLHTTLDLYTTDNDQHHFTSSTLQVAELELENDPVLASPEQHDDNIETITNQFNKEHNTNNDGRSENVKKSVKEMIQAFNNENVHPWNKLSKQHLLSLKHSK